MKRQLDFTQPGGLFVYQNTLDYLQEAYSDVLDAIAAFFGDKVIVQGLVPGGGGTISDGWVVYVDGTASLIPVTGGNVNTYLHLNTLATPEQFADGTSKNVYVDKNFVFSAASGGNVPFADFKRLPYDSNTLAEAFDAIKNIIKLVVNLESAVILSGCAISSVVDLGGGTGTCNISAGTVLMNGEIVNAQAQNAQSYPFWLKPDGTYVTVDPGGTNVKFDYETSQRYVDVLRRQMHGVGEIVMSKSTDDLALFDAGTGVGKWKWKGWKICFDLRSRSPIGYDNRTAQPVGDDNEAWDAAYHALSNFGGEKKHQLVKAELPNINLKIMQGNGIDAYVNDTAGGGALQSLKGDNDNSNGNGDIKTEALGSDTKHETRHPFRVILFIERV